MTRNAWKIAALVFGSGFCALVYQIAWTRDLRLIFGGSTAASAAVVAIFIGGLGLGGLVLGKRAERSPSPLALYATLELGIAATSAATPALVLVARKVYVALGGTVSLGIAGGSVARLVLAALVLGVPTFLMGGTLPALARAIETDEDEGRRGVALLYGVNTLGAVAGCVLANFALLEILGTRTTLWCACLVNALVGMFARAAARDTPRLETTTGAARAAETGAAPRVFVLAAAATVGFAFFLMELVWYRMLGPLLGGTIFTFGLILAIALLGIGVGGGLYSVFLAKRAPRMGAFAITCLLEALFVAIPFALGDRVAMLALFIRPVGSFGFGGFVLGWAAIGAIVVLPAAIVSGVQFPMLIALLGKGRRSVGRDVGLAYAWNTAGAITGALAGGFGLMPALTAPGCWRLVAVVLVVLGAAAIVVAILDRPRGWGSAIAPALLALAAVPLLVARGPTAVWRHSPIGVGRVSPTGFSTTNSVQRFYNEKRRHIAWEAEGVESSVAIDKGNGYAFIVNGKVDGHSRADAETQVMGGLLGALLHPAPKSAMVIGLGTGSTAGWLGQVPSIERVDVAELEPAILEMARRSAPVNRSVLENPKVHVLRGDGREILAVSRQRYDVIFSEPSNPYRAGIASLYTRENYEAAKERLSDDGIFLQWVQAYEVEARTVRTIYATMASAFEYVESWQAKDQDLVLVASRAPIAKSAPVLRARMAEEPYATALRVAWRIDDLEGLLGHYLAGPEVARAIADAEGEALNTDDQALVEFGFAKSLGHDNDFGTWKILDVARTKSVDRAVVAGGPVDWDRVEFQRASLATVENSAPRIPARIGDEWRQRLQMQEHYTRNDFASAHAAWRANDTAREPTSPLEQSIVADVCTHMSDPQSRHYIGLLGRWNPTEAEGLLGIALVHEGNPEAAATMFASSLGRYRADPWPLSVVMYRVLVAANELAEREPRFAPRILEAMSAPFSVYQLEDERLNLVLGITKAQKESGDCAAALLPFEPNVPWTREHLVYRLECYARSGSPLYSRAEADLDEWLAGSPFPFERGL